VANTEYAVSRIKIRGYHTDFYGHVNNARYLELYEENRWVLFENGPDLTKWAKKGLTFAVVNININYRLAILLGMTVEVRGRLEKIGSRSVTVRQEIILADSGKVASDALVTFVLIGKDGSAINMMDSDIKEVRDFVAMLAGTSG
jgi:thioesterase-3